MAASQLSLFLRYLRRGIGPDGAVGLTDAQLLERFVADRGGTLKVKPLRNGPLVVMGNLEVCTGTGHTVLRTQKAALCRCGASRNKPFCDGTHAEIGFSTE